MSSTVPTVPVIATRLDELNPAFEVAQSIVRNMTDMQLTKLLHVHCGGAFLDHFGQVHCIYTAVLVFDMSSIYRSVLLLLLGPLLGCYRLFE